MTPEQEFAESPTTMNENPSPTAEKRRPDPFLAPGCFGAALAYKEEAAECRSCPFKEQCAPLSQENLRILRAELGLTEIATRNGSARSLGHQASTAVPSSPNVRRFTVAADLGGLPANSDWEAVIRELRDEAEVRAAALDERLSHDRHDKRLVKVRGRTQEFVGVWLIRQALRRTSGIEPTAVDVTREYNRRYSASVPARSMRRKIELVDHFEQPGQPWDMSRHGAVEPAPPTSTH